MIGKLDDLVRVAMVVVMLLRFEGIRAKSMTRAGATYKYGGDGDTADWVVDGSTTTRYVGGPGGLSAAPSPAIDATHAISADPNILSDWHGHRGPGSNLGVCLGFQLLELRCS
jgi:hypothetical protein